MTLEEIKGLLEKAQLGLWEAEDTGDVVVASTRRVIADFVPRASDRLLLAAAPELAALLVRAVEALRPFAYPTPYDEYAIVGHDEHGHPLNAEGVQRLSAQSFLRELGVEA